MGRSRRIGRKGLAEKSRLAYQHLSYFTSLYTVARQDYLDLFRRLEDAGVREVVFCGVDAASEVLHANRSRLHR
jgi:hypothetical protein